MAGSKSDAFELEVLRLATGQATTVFTTTPITPFVALFTVAPGDTAGGTEVSTSGTAYARQNASGKWAAPSAGSVQNNASIAFPTATAGYGTVVAFGIYTAVTAGTLLHWGDLTTTKSVASGDTASFASASLVLSED